MRIQDKMKPTLIVSMLIICIIAFLVFMGTHLVPPTENAILCLGLFLSMACILIESQNDRDFTAIALVAGAITFGVALYYGMSLFWGAVFILLTIGLCAFMDALKSLVISLKESGCDATNLIYLACIFASIGGWYYLFLFLKTVGK